MHINLTSWKKSKLDKFLKRHKLQKVIKWWEGKILVLPHLDYNLWTLKPDFKGTWLQVSTLFSQCLCPHIKGRKWLYLLQRAIVKLKWLVYVNCLEQNLLHDKSIRVDYFYKIRNKNTKVKICLQNISTHVYLYLYIFKYVHLLRVWIHTYIDICMYLCMCIHTRSKCIKKS